LLGGGSACAKLNLPGSSLLSSSSGEAKDDTTTQLASASIPTSSTPSKFPKHPKEELHYALTRLIQGLASRHESARFGFAVVLTEYLFALLLPQHQARWVVSIES